MIGSALRKKGGGEPTDYKSSLFKKKNVDMDVSCFVIQLFNSTSLISIVPIPSNENTIRYFHELKKHKFNLEKRVSNIKCKIKSLLCISELRLYHFLYEYLLTRMKIVQWKYDQILSWIKKHKFNLEKGVSNIKCKIKSLLCISELRLYHFLDEYLLTRSIIHVQKVSHH